MVGIVSESDLILGDEEADLHLPHYLNIMGGIVFVGSMKGFEKRLDKAFATKVSELMTADPIVVHTYEDGRGGRQMIAEKHHNHLPVVDGEGRLAGHGHPGRRVGRARRRRVARWSGRSPGSTSALSSATARG